MSGCCSSCGRECAVLRMSDGRCAWCINADDAEWPARQRPDTGLDNRPRT